MTDKSRPLNERNNNPLNIRANDIQWDGKVGESGGFVKFESVEYGFRAAAKLLANYSRLYGINTVRTIIERWAPPEDDNHTENYIGFIARNMNLSGDSVVTAEMYPELMLFMSQFEGSKRFTIEQSQVGAAMV